MRKPLRKSSTQVVLCWSLWKLLISEGCRHTGYRQTQLLPDLKKHGKIPALPARVAYVASAPPTSRLLRFGVFDLDLEACELRKSGMRMKLGGQSFQVLQILVEHPQQVVTREVLKQHLWAQDTHVDYDLALKRLINRIREVLGDSAENPRFIETLPRMGYRFIAPVIGVPGTGVGESESTSVERGPTAPASRRSKARMWQVFAAAAVMVGLLLAVTSGRFRQFFVSESSSAPNIRSIAVLPLANLSPDPGQEYFSDGLTDSLITELAQIGSLKVISHTSTMQYKKTAKPLPQIARELNVDGIVEGTVQRSGDRVRITAQLIHGPTDKHIWANTYDGERRDIFALERDVADDIAQQIRARVTTHGSDAAVRRAIKPEALESYLQGNYYMNRGSGDADMKRAQKFFQEAVDADPTFVRAYAGLAWSHYLLIDASAEDRKIRRAAAEKAVTLDSTSADAHSVLGEVRFSDWDFRGAEAEWRRAIALDPNGLEGHDGLCLVLNVTLRLEESLSECNIAQMLDPDNDHLSQTFEARRQYDRAIESLERQTRHHPDDGFLHYYLFRDYLLVGMQQKSIEELEQALRLLGRADAAAAVRSAYSTSGYRGALRTMAAIFEQLSKSGRMFLPRVVAEIYAQLGDKDRAFYWLEQGYVHHDRVATYGGLEFITIEHILDPLVSDRRYKDLLDRIGLPEEEPSHPTVQRQAARAVLRYGLGEV